MSRLVIAAASLAALLVPMLPAHAGPYDGRWVVDFPTPVTNFRSSGNVCSTAFRLVVEVKDNQLVASLQREPVTGEVMNSTAPDAVAIRGSVAPDGTVTATWENFPVIGRLSGDTGAISVNGDCGPRTGRAVRVR